MPPFEQFNLDQFDLGVEPNSVVAKLLATGLVALLAFAIRGFITSALTRYVSSADMRRRFLVAARNATLLLMVATVGVIWISEIRSVAVWLAAVAVAVVIATKELIICLAGALVRTTTNAFSIGDRIEVGVHRGDVIDFNLLNTTILEVGPGKSFHMRTGRTVVIPNARFLDTAVINESYTKRFVAHAFSVPVPANEDWHDAEKRLQQAAERQVEPYLEDARRHMRRLEEEHGLHGLPTQPRVFVQIPEPGKLELLVRLPTPVGAQGRIEQAVLREFLDQIVAPVGAEPSGD